MTRFRFIPFIMLAGFGLLAVIGARGKAFNQPGLISCAYHIAGLDRPAPDVLLLGNSRLGQGLDHGYMMKRLRETTGQDVSIERLGLTSPNLPQFQPLVRRYLANRGTPKLVLLQLMYRSNPDVLREIDVPVNMVRNINMATLPELIAIREGALLNDFDTALPRTFEAGYRSLPELILQKFEINIYSGLRYLPLRLTGGLEPCAGDAMMKQTGRNWPFNDIDGTTAFTPRRKESSRDKKRWAFFEAQSRAEMHRMPAAPLRRFENDQLQTLVALLQAAGSEVHFFLMPALFDTKMPAGELVEIQSIFPDIPISHPYALFDSKIGPELVESWVDPHHASPYGALQYSRYYADVIKKILNP